MIFYANSEFSVKESLFIYVPLILSYQMDMAN